MKQISTLFVLLFTLVQVHAQVLISRNAAISFFSSTVVEDIEAKSNTAGSAINTGSGEIVFRVSNTSFRFQKKLMQEHFNENYMESDKFPHSEFKGKITGAFDPQKEGNYPVNVSGNLNVHGVTKAYTVPANLTVNKDSITARATFKVRIADHGIKIPSLVFKNIAEFVEVRVQALYLQKK
ncbi:YceI family protein [Pedobacter deserti]|uniref:YceI family protein n=1 Tax=Pedobacter deserti TaxID=2817382 RepID=UPI002108EE9A|nr:YceI family protein [Pedobacter sp. SYSU D00382]